MNFAFDQTTQTIYQQVIDFCKKELPAADLVYRDQHELFAIKLWEACGDFHIQGFPVDKAYGGLGLSTLDAIVALEAFGKGCMDEGLSFSVGAHLLSVVVPLWLYGLKQQKDYLLKDLATGRKIAAHAMTEANAGSDVFAMKTEAKKENGSYIINGEKCYITNAPVCEVLLVYTLTDAGKGAVGGITAFLVERERSGITISDNISKMGLRTCTMGTVKLDNVMASSADILGGKGGGLKVFQESMNWERIGMSAILVGNIGRLFETLAYFVKQRANAQQQTIFHSLAMIKARLESIRIMVYHAAWSLEHNRKDVSVLASSVKLLASELYKQAASEAVQIMGAHGYSSEVGVERFLRNAVASTIYSGTSEIQKNIIAQHLNLK